MRTVVTYLDENRDRTSKEKAWTIMTQIFNDAGNLQRTGYSIGEAQAKAQAGHSSAAASALIICDETSGKEYRFNKPVVKAGRDSSCDMVFDQKEDKKKIDKIHAIFELRQGTWHVLDSSKVGVWINTQKIAPNTPVAVKAGDCIDLGRRRMLRIK